MVIIPEQFKATRKNFERYKSFIQLYPPDDLEQLYLYDLEDTLKDPDTGQLWDELLSKSFLTDYKKHVEKGEYFIGCPFKIYSEQFEKRKKEFTTGSDASDIDFLAQEYANTYHEAFGFCPDNIKKEIQFSTTRTREFLDEKIAKTPYKLEYHLDDLEEISFSYAKKINHDSDTNELIVDERELTHVEKAAYLELMGVFDYVRSLASHGISENKLAKVMSFISGVPHSTMQRYINGIRDKGGKNDPLRDKDRTALFKNRLEDQGLKLPIR